MVVYDITNAESFAKAKNWVKELQRQGNPNMIMALAGNKADLAAQRTVTVEEAKVSYSDAHDKHMMCTVCCNLYMYIYNCACLHEQLQLLDLLQVSLRGGLRQEDP